MAVNLSILSPEDPVNPLFFASGEWSTDDNDTVSVVGYVYQGSTHFPPTSMGTEEDGSWWMVFNLGSGSAGMYQLHVQNIDGTADTEQEVEVEEPESDKNPPPAAKDGVAKPLTTMIRKKPAAKKKSGKKRGRPPKKKAAPAPEPPAPVVEAE